MNNIKKIAKEILKSADSKKKFKTKIEKLLKKFTPTTEYSPFIENVMSFRGELSI